MSELPPHRRSMEGSHITPGIARAQRDVHRQYQENIRPADENSGADLSITTRHGIHGTHLPADLLGSITSTGALRDQRSSLGLSSADRGTGPSSQSEFEPSLQIRTNESEEFLSSTLPLVTHPAANDFRVQYDFRQRDSRPLLAMAPNLVDYPARFCGGNYSQTGSFHSAMPYQDGFHPLQPDHRDTNYFPSTNQNASKNGFKDVSQAAQGSQYSHLYQESPYNTANSLFLVAGQAGPAARPKLSTQMQPGLRREKLCNNYHLRGACLLGDACRYIHGIISDTELRELKRIAKGMVCKFGLNCSDELCYAGHKCPYQASGHRQCDFPDEMHFDGPEESRGRVEMATHHNALYDNHHGPLQYASAEPHDQQEVDYHQTQLEYLSQRSVAHEEKLIRTRKGQNPVNEEDKIQREVQELLENLAPSKKGLTRSVVTTIPGARQVTDFDLDLFQETLTTGIKSSRVIRSPPPQQAVVEQDIASTTIPRSGTQRRSPLPTGNIAIKDEHSIHRNVSKRRRQSEPRSIRETEEDPVGPTLDSYSLAHRHKRRSKNKSRQLSAFVRTCDYVERKEFTSSPPRVDSWRPNWHLKGDYWRPRDH